MVMDDGAKRDILRELIVLRSEYSMTLLSDLSSDARKHASRMIAELSACIERLEQALRVN